ncbi:hypothetical protein TNCV_4357971 [Trichonephila clavipes]|nr:hypothetical protein TNCV_4357971 [Trichonephila clavipes]
MSDYTNDGYAPHVRPIQLQWMPRRNNVPGPLSEEPMSTPYLNDLDLFLWGLLKSLVCETPVNTVEDVSVFVTSADVTNTPDLFVCRTQLSCATRIQLRSIPVAILCCISDV